MDVLTLIGKTVKPHGLNGEIKCVIEETYLADLMQAEVILIAQKGQKLPYFINNVRVGNATILSLEEVDTKEAANHLRNSELFMREADLLPEVNRVFDNLTYSKYEGFQLVDKELGTIGVIEEIVEMPQQEMAVINYKEKEILIPLNENFIVSNNEDEKILTVELPKGLLDIF